MVVKQNEKKPDEDSLCLMSETLNPVLQLRMCLTAIDANAHSKKLRGMLERKILLFLSRECNDHSSLKNLSYRDDFLES